MPSAHRALPLLVAVAALLALPGAAFADMPGNPRCDADGKGCTMCWKPYGDSAEAMKQFEACVSGATAKGLVNACTAMQGAGDGVFYCPAGVKVPIRSGGGCAGCATSGEGASATALAVLAGLGALAVRRRRRR